jgi:hypothetical protein
LEQRASTVMIEPRRFPPPWTIVELGTRFTVKDGNGIALASIYFEGEPGQTEAPNLLTKDEARRIAANITKLPGLLARWQRASTRRDRSRA